MNIEADQMAKRVGDDMTFAIIDFLAGVKAVRATRFGGFHRLTVDHVGGWRGLRLACSRASITSA